MLLFVCALRWMESKPTRPKFAASPKSPPNRSTVSSAVNMLVLSTMIGLPTSAANATFAETSMDSADTAAMKGIFPRSLFSKSFPSGFLLCVDWFCALVYFTLPPFLPKACNCTCRATCADARRHSQSRSTRTQALPGCFQEENPSRRKSLRRNWWHCRMRGR